MRAAPEPLCVLLSITTICVAVSRTYTGLGGREGGVRFAVDYDAELENPSLELTYACGGKGGYIRLTQFDEVFERDFDSDDSDDEAALGYLVDSQIQKNSLLQKLRSFTKRRSAHMEQLESTENDTREDRGHRQFFYEPWGMGISIYDMRDVDEEELLYGALADKKKVDTRLRFTPVSESTEEQVMKKFNETCGEKYGQIGDDAVLLLLPKVTDDLLYLSFLGKVSVLARGQAPFPVGRFHLDGNEGVTFRGEGGPESTITLGERGMKTVVSLSPWTSADTNDRLINVMARDALRNVSVFREAWRAFLREYGRLFNNGTTPDSDSFMEFSWREEDDTWVTKVDRDERRLVLPRAFEELLARKQSEPPQRVGDDLVVRKAFVGALRQNGG
ncbi:hypothetical protein FOZ63_008486, partial [Perkinsus olseni]